MRTRNIAPSILRAFILNFLTITLLFATVTVIHMHTDILIEMSQDLESNNDLDSEKEKEIETDDEIEKISFKQEFYLPLYNKSSFYFIKEEPSSFFESIKLPPPERL